MWIIHCKLNISIYTLRVAFRARRNWLPVEHYKHTCAVCVAAKWQPGPPGAPPSWARGHCWAGTLLVALILLIILAAQLVPSLPCTRSPVPSSAPGPISTQLPANGFTVTVTPVNTIIYHTLRQFQGIGNNRDTGGAAILTFLLPKAYMLYQLLKFKTYLTIQLSYMWTGWLKVVRAAGSNKAPRLPSGRSLLRCQPPTAF